MIRATLYEELGAARRARLHRKVGEALEALADVDPDTKIDELAYHWLAATQVADAAKAIGYARRAGDRALAGLAFDEAAAHYERALGVLQPRGPRRRAAALRPLDRDGGGAAVRRQSAVPRDSGNGGRAGAASRARLGESDDDGAIGGKKDLVVVRHAPVNRGSTRSKSQ
jgi:predicted ATPase